MRISMMPSRYVSSASNSRFRSLENSLLRTGFYRRNRFPSSSSSSVLSNFRSSTPLVPDRWYRQPPPSITPSSRTSHLFRCFPSLGFLHSPHWKPTFLPFLRSTNWSNTEITSRSPQRWYWWFRQERNGRSWRNGKVPILAWNW